jgi:hypothetical protein
LGAGGKMQKQYGSHPKFVFTVALDGDKYWTISIKQVKFCTDIDSKYTYKYCMKLYLHINNYEHGNCAKLLS